jgi:hypothetical protein
MSQTAPRSLPSPARHSSASLSRSRDETRYGHRVSQIYIAFLVAAGILLIAAEWPRLSQLRPIRPLAARLERAGEDRAFKKAVIKKKPETINELEDRTFAADVLKDLDSLPTISEKEIKRGPQR